MRFLPVRLLGALLLRADLLCAQGPQLAPIRLRSIGPVVARSRDVFGPLVQVRPLSDGRVLVNDFRLRQLVIMDSSLTASAAVFANTAGGSAKVAHGAHGGGLLAYYGDSSLYADLGSSAMLLVSPSGAVARTIDPPKGDRGGLGYTYLPEYNSAFDGTGHVLSEWPAVQPARSRGDGAAPLVVPASRDSAALVRISVATKKVDTVTWLAAALRITGYVAGPTGSLWRAPIYDPMATTDDWTVMRNGTVAVIRGAPYHIEWIAPNGTHSLSPEIPHEWGRLTDSAKRAFVDSVATITLSMQDAPAGTTGGVGGRGGARATDVAPALAVASLPAYRPAFTGYGNARPDADGNVWIRVNQTAASGQQAYDVVNLQGRLVDRVLIPAYATIVAFAPNALFLTVREGAALRLVRRRIR